MAQTWIDVPDIPDEPSLREVLREIADELRTANLIAYAVAKHQLGDTSRILYDARHRLKLPQGRNVR